MGWFERGFSSSRKCPRLKKFRREYVIIDILGYTPGVQIPVGIARLTSGICLIIFNKFSLGYTPKHSLPAWAMTRGIIECLSLGIIFLPLDCIYAHRRMMRLWWDNERTFNPKGQPDDERIKLEFLYNATLLQIINPFSPQTPPGELT